MGRSPRRRSTSNTYGCRVCGGAGIVEDMKRRDIGFPSGVSLSICDRCQEGVYRKVADIRLLG